MYSTHLADDHIQMGFQWEMKLCISDLKVYRIRCLRQVVLFGKILRVLLWYMAEDDFRVILSLSLITTYEFWLEGITLYLKIKQREQ